MFSPYDPPDFLQSNTPPSTLYNPAVKSVPSALTIAGSDSGGCAGIQADLKTFAALGVHGTSAITAVTAQNTQRVTRVLELPVEIIEAQIEAIVEDIALGAVKTGMLASSEIIRAVARQIRRHEFSRLVVDPVMVSTAGDRLLDASAVATLQSELLPLSLLATPNVREAEALSGEGIQDLATLKQAARRILDLGPRAVLIKGGHLADPQSSTDYLFESGSMTPFTGPRHATRHTHGSGCTLAAAICAFLARGFDLRDSVSHAKAYVSKAIAAAFPVGKGSGPLGHLAEWWRTLEHPSE